MIADQIFVRLCFTVIGLQPGDLAPQECDLPPGKGVMRLAVRQMAVALDVLDGGLAFGLQRRPRLVSSAHGRTLSFTAFSTSSVVIF